VREGVGKVFHDRRAPRFGDAHKKDPKAFLLRFGRADVASRGFDGFIKHCEGNPREWGVTRRWEIATAKELLARPGRSQNYVPIVTAASFRSPDVSPLAVNGSRALSF
jgi:hypothetical protein